MAILTSIFFKIANDEDSFHVQWYAGENEITCGHVETSGTRKTVFMSNLFHAVILLY